MFQTSSAHQCLTRRLYSPASCDNGLLLLFSTGVLLTLAFGSARGEVSSVGKHFPTLSYSTLSGAELAKVGLTAPIKAPSDKIPGRRVPTLTLFSELGDGRLISNAVSLAEANTLAGRNFFEGRFGRVQMENDVRWFNPGIILIKFRNAQHVAALRVEPMRELDALRAVRERSDVEFAELDSFQQRQFHPNDALLSSQWHHAVIGSFQAWDHSLGEAFVRVAIVDTPFQMDHPDLAAHADAGWDVVSGLPVTSASGIDHSTLGAGLIAAVIGNQIGVAGASNCRILPINISGAISEMYDSVIWAADHGVRLVNISWTGAYSDTLNVAGNYLKTTARGILAMAGVNGTGFLDYTNQPNIYCISMTDAADNQRSRFGNHIDFAAPGWAIYSTVTNGGYTFATGTSYSTPLFCGVVATLFSINPTLGPDEVIQLMKNTATDLGEPGWDQYFGWGRINFAAAAAVAEASRPRIVSLQLSNGLAVVTVTNQPTLSFTLLKSPVLDTSLWTTVTNAIQATNAGVLTLTDPSLGENAGFYRVEARVR